MMGNPVNPKSTWQTVEGQPLASPLEKSRGELLRIRATLEAAVEENLKQLEQARLRLARLRNGGSF